MRRRVGAVLMLAAVVAVSAGCGGDDGATSGEAATSTVAVARPLRILVSNDDGVAGPGLDVLVEALRQVPDVELTVVAPAEDQSGSSDRTTAGGVEYVDASTASGYPAVAVAGFPADSVLVALDELGATPDLVVSGINTGQNAGPVAAISGTVGVARTAVRRGIPALAVSGPLAFDPAVFALAAELVVDWIAENRQALVDGTVTTEVAFSINLPTCPADAIGALREVPLATAFPEGRNPLVDSSCDQAGDPPTDDVLGLLAGYAVLTQVPPELATAAG
jgi:5'-nucleotidase